MKRKTGKGTDKGGKKIEGKKAIDCANHVLDRLLGTASMAAEGIAHPFYSISSMVSGLLAVGMQSICSEDLAHGKVKEMQRVFSMTAIVAFVMSCLMTCLLFFGSEQVAILLGARGNAAHLLPESSLYLRGLALGCIPSVLSAILCGAIQLDSGSRLIQIAALTGSFTDVVFPQAEPWECRHSPSEITSEIFCRSHWQESSELPHC